MKTIPPTITAEKINEMLDDKLDCLFAVWTPAEGLKVRKAVAMATIESIARVAEFDRRLSEHCTSRGDEAQAVAYWKSYCVLKAHTGDALAAVERASLLPA